jgi:hypothetical protein
MQRHISAAAAAHHHLVVSLCRRCQCSRLLHTVGTFCCWWC